jgi:hypothetical protein
MPSRLSLLLLSYAIAIGGCAPSATPTAKPAPSTATTGDGPNIVNTPSAPEDGTAGLRAELVAAATDRFATLSLDDLLIRIQDEKDRPAAAAEVTRRGEPAVAPLVTVLSSAEKPASRAAAAFALGLLGKSAADAVAPLQKAAASDADGTVRDAAQFALDAITEGK